MLPEKVVWAIVLMVSAIWGGNMVADLVVSNFEPNPAIHGVFGGVFAGAIAVKKKGSGNDG